MSSNPKAITLEDDGVSEEFFHLLWSKDELNYGPNINIPDTIVFKYGQPTVWYFTSSNGKIKRKNRSNLIASKIEDALKSYVLGYDVIATFISIAIEKDPVTGARPPTTMQYMDKDQLVEFLYKRDKNAHGILQRFVEPKGTKNETVRAIWSPKVCLLERAENKRHLHDMRYGIYERCVTYDGPEYYIESSPLRGPVLAGQVQKVCEAVVSHIAEVTFAQKQISRIVINFKIDSREKLWLLYTTSIRCGAELMHGTAAARLVSARPPSLLNIDSVVSLPTEVNLNPLPTYDEIIPKSRIRCLSCNTETLEDLRHPVTYKSLITHYEHVLHLVSSLSENQQSIIRWPPDQNVIEAAGGVGFGCLEMISDEETSSRKNLTVDLRKPLDSSELRIPPILRYLHPKLNPMSYVRCRKDPLFLYKTVMVCESCYLVFAEFATMVLRMGRDLTSLLRPDPSAADLGTTTKSSTIHRPNSADWRALSTVNRSSSADNVGLKSSHGFRPSGNHKHAKEVAIGIRSSDRRLQPIVPDPIRGAQDVEPIFTSISAMEYQQQSMLSKSGSPAQISLERSISAGMGGVGSKFSAGSLDPDNIAAMAAERERHFYKEISRNPQLRDQHPLMHLINAQRKLQIVNQQSGVGLSRAASEAEGTFSTGYGKQTSDYFNPLGAYMRAIPYVIDHEIILPSKLKKLREMKKLKKREQLRVKLERQRQQDALLQSIGMSGSPVSHSSLGHSTVADDTTSAEKHRQFLETALKNIEGELDKAAPYAAMVPPDKPAAAESRRSTARSALGSSSRRSASGRARRSAERRASREQHAAASSEDTGNMSSQYRPQSRATSGSGSRKSSPVKTPLHGGKRHSSSKMRDSNEAPQPADNTASADSSAEGVVIKNLEFAPISPPHKNTEF